MKKSYSVSVDIEAAPERVWEVMRDVERWHEWTPSIRRIDLLDRTPFGVGSRVRVLQPKLPPARWTVTQADAGQGFTWISRAPGLLVTGHHRIAPLGRGSRATLCIEYEGLFGPLLARLTHRLNEEYVAAEAAGLKRRCEGR